LQVQIYLKKEDFIEWPLTSTGAMLSQYGNRSTPRILLIFVLVILGNQFECVIRSIVISSDCYSHCLL